MSLSLSLPLSLCVQPLDPFNLSGNVGEVITPKTKKNMSPDANTARTQRYKALTNLEGKVHATCRLQLFETQGKGKGLKTTKRINKADLPIVEYVGAWVKNYQASDSRYLVALAKTDNIYAIDALKCGNIARCVSHSQPFSRAHCIVLQLTTLSRTHLIRRFINGVDDPEDKPNCIMYESQEGRIFIYSLRRIERGVELKMDYGPGFYKKVHNMGTGKIEYEYN